jgi:N-acyl-D-aspartate/D-glutamate deacylase
MLLLIASLLASQQFDVVLRNARIVDGTGSPSYHADLAVREGKVAAIGRLGTATAKRVIDVQGQVVAPGFIDMMGQTGAPFISDPNTALSLLTQGVTTLNAGEGGSDAPLSAADAAKAGWSTMREFFSRLEGAGMPMNVAQTVGLTQIREIVIGDKDRQATPDELTRMKGMVEEAMLAGAIGTSTSLIYPPAIYASEAELAALTEVAGRYGGRYFTHMRNEGDRLLEAIDEALRIGQAAKTPVHIYHLKTAGQANWGKMDLALARIKAARASGQDVGVDVYPYINNGLGIRALLHPRNAAQGQAELMKRLADPAQRAVMRKEMETEIGWENWYVHAGRDWDRIVLGSIQHPAYKQYDGMTVKGDCGQDRQGSVGRVLRDLPERLVSHAPDHERRQQDESDAGGVHLVRYRCGAGRGRRLRLTSARLGRFPPDLRPLRPRARRDVAGGRRASRIGRGRERNWCVRSWAPGPRSPRRHRGLRPEYDP